MSERPYRSAYGDARLTSAGTFMAFTVSVEAAHVRDGYWRFTDEGDGEDDLRAYQLGFQSPEQVLLAALSDEGQYDNRCDIISLRWLPGEMDTFRLSRIGTARQHIQHIVEERVQLSYSAASFQGSVPVYPIDTQQRLLGFRQRRISGNGPLKREPNLLEVPQQNGQSFPSASRSPQYATTPSPGYATHTRYGQSASGISRSLEFAANVDTRADNNRSTPSDTTHSGSPRTSFQVQLPVRPSLEGCTPPPPGYPRTEYASSAATIPFQSGTRTARQSEGSPPQSQNRHIHPQPASNGRPAALNSTPSNGYGATYARRLPTSLVANNATATPYSSPYTPPYVSPYASPYGSVSPYHSQGTPAPTPRHSPYGVLPSSYFDLVSLNTPVATNTTLSAGPQGPQNERDQKSWDVSNRSPTHATPHAGQQAVVTTPAPNASSPVHTGFDRSKRLPTAALAASKPRPENISPNVEHGPAAQGAVRNTVSLPSVKSDLFEPTTLEFRPTSPASVESVKTDNPAQPQNINPQEHHVDTPEVTILQMLPPTSGHSDASHPDENAPAHFSALHQDPSVSPKKPNTLFSPRLRLTGGDLETVDSDPFSIPLEVPLHDARYDPEDPFITDVMPLSEDVSCVDCGGTEYHAWGCHIASILPLEDPNDFQLHHIAEQVERFDPEQWREHWNPPSTPPETETMAEKIDGMAEILRNDESYQNDPELQGLPDSALLFFWALKNSANCMIMNSNGEFPVPPGFEHLWDDDDENEGAGESTGDGTEMDTDAGTREHTREQIEMDAEASKDEVLEGGAEHETQGGGAEGEAGGVLEEVAHSG
ncbi:hypothetical protein K458DRAFT_396648 [Lentithecium fluviatile CBS 122367]|uniref:Uncharacterized protein n=1 Tax=Lentithecium fluviatile CBS 122367 TaxID=1168545 RepID=A0A6G1IEU5_9PLEO|nr:hypothetical protein K458DRAFT_396648 [Lentithecium fluviatile CBS 122367]